VNLSRPDRTRSSWAERRSRTDVGRPLFDPATDAPPGSALDWYLETTVSVGICRSDAWHDPEDRGEGPEATTLDTVMCSTIA
jgi:hypothetical protein